MIRPDYAGGGIVNLMASLEAGLGGEPLHPPAPALAAAEVAEARHVLLMVIDGLGHDWLLRHGGGALREHVSARLTSVFPSTTAAAITTFFTARAPLQHGLTGWWTNIEPGPGVVAPLPFRRRDGRALVEDGVQPGQCFREPPLFTRLRRECHVVHPAELVGTPYNRFHAAGASEHGYESLDECVELVAELLRVPGPQRYVYAYWPELDRISHQRGCGSRAARRHLAALERAVERLLETLRGRGCLLLFTADHGFVDTRPDTRLELESLPDLERALRLPLCGEPRSLICHLRDGADADFETVVRERLDGRATLLAGREMVAQGWFGTGRAHPAMASRAGDRVLLLEAPWVIDDHRTGKPVHVGEHGGASEAEMMVPLVKLRP